jgi:hypothetical protein
MASLLDSITWFRHEASRRCQGARGVVDIRGWEDPAPIFRVICKNGVEFQDSSSCGAIRAASNYLETVKALTGEYP